VSIHFNASSGTSSKGIGTEMLIYNAKHNATAKAITDAIALAGGFKNRGVKVRTDLGLLKSTNKPCHLMLTHGATLSTMDKQQFKELQFILKHLQLLVM
jgi:N-acetylmuramoyl-L-alanine amidase